LKVLFDEDVPGKLARSLPRHEIHTVVSMQWGSIKNGELLTLIERERFDVFLTGDKNMDKQQRLEGRPFAVLIMSAINWPVVGPHIDKISVALDKAEAGTVKTIDCGVFIAHENRRSG
jgi:predicted nuclease of predicted toxin-antitoxin system